MKEKSMKNASIAMTHIGVFLFIFFFSSTLFDHRNEYTFNKRLLSFVSILLWKKKMKNNHRVHYLCYNRNVKCIALLAKLMLLLLLFVRVQITWGGILHSWKIPCIHQYMANETKKKCNNTECDNNGLLCCMHGKFN